jgi:hypothetical protein
MQVNRPRAESIFVGVFRQSLSGGDWWHRGYCARAGVRACLDGDGPPSWVCWSWFKFNIGSKLGHWLSGAHHQQGFQIRLTMGSNDPEIQSKNISIQSPVPDIGIVETDLQPGIYTINTRFATQTNKPDTIVDFGGSGIRVRNVEHDALLLFDG